MDYLVSTLVCHGGAGCFPLGWLILSSLGGRRACPSRPAATLPAGRLFRFFRALFQISALYQAAAAARRTSYICVSVGFSRFGNLENFPLLVRTTDIRRRRWYAALLFLATALPSCVDASLLSKRAASIGSQYPIPTLLLLVRRALRAQRTV